MHSLVAASGRTQTLAAADVVVVAAAGTAAAGNHCID